MSFLIYLYNHQEIVLWALLILIALIVGKVSQELVRVFRNSRMSMRRRGWMSYLPLIGSMRQKKTDHQKKVKNSYMLFEIVHVIVWAAAYQTIGLRSWLAFVLMSVTVLMIMYWTFIEIKRIPIVLQVVLFVIALAFVLADVPVNLYGTRINLFDQVIGAMIGVVGVAFSVGRYVIKKAGEEKLDGLDMGLLVMTFGLFTGYLTVLATVIIALVMNMIGLIVVAIFDSKGRNKGIEIGYFLIPTCVFVLLLTGELVQGYYILMG